MLVPPWVSLDLTTSEPSYNQFYGLATGINDRNSIAFI